MLSGRCLTNGLTDTSVVITHAERSEVNNPVVLDIPALDAVKGYWQVPLDEKSQNLTTFITPYGRYKFLRAPMGLTSSQDEYCFRGDEAIQGNNRVEKVVDGIPIHSSSTQDNLNTVVTV